MDWPSKYAVESKVYGVDFSNRLSADEQIQSHTVSVELGSVVATQDVHDEKTVSFRLTGGAQGEIASIIVTCSTNATPANVLARRASVKIL